MLRIEHEPAADPHLVPVVGLVFVAPELESPGLEGLDGPFGMLLPEARGRLDDYGDALTLLGIGRQRHVPVDVIREVKMGSLSIRRCRLRSGSSSLAARSSTPKPEDTLSSLDEIRPTDAARPLRPPWWR